MVFDHVDTFDDSKIIHPLSEVLRPYVERNQYGDVECDYPHFLLLCQTIRDSPPLAILVKNLFLNESMSSEATQDFQVEHEEIVFSFFQRATALSDILIYCHVPRLRARMM